MPPEVRKLIRLLRKAGFKCYAPSQSAQKIIVERPDGSEVLRFSKTPRNAGNEWANVRQKLTKAGETVKGITDR